MGKLSTLWHALKGPDEDTLYSLTHLSTILSEVDHREVERLCKWRKVELEDERFRASTRLVPELHYPQLKVKDPEYAAFGERINEIIRLKMLEEQRAAFAPRAKSTLQSFVAPNIVGLDHVKEAALLQLVMPERFHILLLGDPGTGKTDILRSAAELAPISTFGLGSGASKAGLAVSSSGKQIQKGILVTADGGLCCIDELNLMKADDRAALYNAMEKGFVTYDKGTLHERLGADVRLLATANPKGDQFRGTDIAAIRKQLPFDSALLSRFQLLFIIRKPDVKRFKEISGKILRGDNKPLSKEDIAFVHNYLRHAKQTTVQLPANLESEIVDAVTSLKAREAKLLIEVTPRLTKGVASLAKAHARIALRDTVTKADVQAAIAIVERSLAVV